MHKLDPEFSTPAARCRDHVVVVGAGIAGATIAYALALRGSRVTVLESGNSTASGASGNARAVVRPFLARNSSDVLAQFYDGANRHTIAHILSLNPSIQNKLRVRTGALWQHEAAASLRPLGNKVALLGAEQATAQVGVASRAGLWMPDAASVSPAAYCNALLAHPLVSVKVASEVAHLQFMSDSSRWQAISATGQCLATGDAMIIAAGPTMTRLLPEYTNTVHTTQGASITAALKRDQPGLRATQLGEVSMTPADDSVVLNGGHWRKPLSEDQAITHFPFPVAIDKTAITDVRLSQRLHTPDRLPLAGPVSNFAETANRFQTLRHGKPISAPAQYQAGLYLLGGLGGRGITSALWVAERLAQAICGEADSLRALHPLRFLVRALRRNQPI